MRRELCYVPFIYTGNKHDKLFIWEGLVNAWVYCCITHTFNLKRKNISRGEILEGNTLES